MSRIPDSTIEAVRHAVDLVDVVSDYVRLKKQGVRFIGLCPFHNEKTPSFSVDPRQDLFYCFGCKKGGDLFKFVGEIEGVGFLDAVRLLAARAGIEIAEEEGEREAASEREAMSAALRFAAGFFFDQLKRPSGKRGLDYLRERGFSKETVKTFGIGYAPDAWDALLKAATREGYKPEVLEAVGLVKRRESGDGSEPVHRYYDVFRDRLTFPIFDRAGNVLGFGGRILPGSKQAREDYTPAKYINTPETAVYHKSDVLFGLKQAKRAVRAEEEAVLVEGYADVVSLHQAGIENTVALSGTALTSSQVRIVAQIAQRVVLLLDADAAGQGAAFRSVGPVLNGGLTPFVVVLPEGADPDSFVRQFGGEALRNLIKHERTDFVSFVASRARKRGDLSTPEGESRVVDQVVSIIAGIRDPVAQDAYFIKAGQALGIPDVFLRRHYAKLVDRSKHAGVAAPDGPLRFAPPDDAPAGAPVAAPAAAPPPVLMRPEEADLLRLMLEHGATMVEHVLTRMALDEFSAGVVREAVARLIGQYEAGAVEAEPFLRGDFGEVMQRLAAEVLSEKHVLSANWQRRAGITVPGLDAQPYETASSAMRLLKLDRVEEAIVALQRGIFQAQQSGEDLTPLLRQQNDLNALKGQIERGAFLEWGAEQGG